MSDTLTWVDIETFGLNPQTDPILEIGFFVTDANLKVVNRRSYKIWGDRHELAYKYLKGLAETGSNDEAKYVFDMHTKNALFEEARAYGMDSHHVDMMASQWLEQIDAIGGPMCGSSVHNDRNFLTHQFPQIANSFHYRNIDVSTIKEVCRRLNPELFAKAPIDGNAIHRVFSCLTATVAEFDFYRNEFLLW